MEREQLVLYISTQIQTGIGSEEIKARLNAVGWPEDTIESAYAEALVTNGVPAPNTGTRGNPTKKSSTVEIILNFFSFILLGIVTFALGGLYFAIINYFFPDDLYNGYSYYYRDISDTVHYATAALIIGYPLYYAAVRLWFTKFRRDETKQESKLTKWITYLVLLSVSITIVGDLIFTVYTMLQGELTIRFFLKALTILAIAGMIFGFYFLERRKVQYQTAIPRRTFQLFGYTCTALVVLGIILGFAATGSPSTERQRTFDEQRSADLANLANCIESYAQDFNQFPDSLNDLKLSNYSYCADNILDPETNTAYTYRIFAPLTAQNNRLVGQFELCATFSLTSDYTNQSKWYTHSAGRDCDLEMISINPNRPF